MPRASLGKLKNTIFPSRVTVTTAAAAYDLPNAAWGAQTHCRRTAAQYTYLVVCLLLCVRIIIYFPSIETQQSANNKNRMCVCMYIMNVLDSRESSVQIHEKNKFCDENVQFLCSMYKK